MPNKTEKLFQLVRKFKKIIHFAFGALFLGIIALTFSHIHNLDDFSATVIPTKMPAPFDGTALPAEKVAKWTALTESERNLSYDQIPQGKLIPLPFYDPEKLNKPLDKVGWKSEEDIALRNARITHSTLYMANYKFGPEYSGSHLAIDIKLPKDTPINAIGNGIVVKVADQATGFGKHIVVKHENFPSYEDPGKKVTLYSSYSHLNEILVAEGQVVKKGERIGKSGQSGLASTPHLHFQIDTAAAPWHPFWPFTSQEAADAGVSFNEAVNIGLGKEKALTTTINPMLYIQKYMKGGSSPNSPTPPPQKTEKPPIDQVPPKSNEKPVTNDIPANNEIPPIPGNNGNSTTPEVNSPEEPSFEPAAAFSIKHDGSFVVGAPETFTVEAIDEKGTTVKSYKPADRVYIKVTSGAADVPKQLTASDFTNGSAFLSVTPTAEVGLQIEVTDMEISGESKVMASDLFTDLDENSSTYKQIQVLKKYGVVGGYPDGTFQPSRVVSRVEALKFIVKGTRLSLSKEKQLPFPDLKASEWYGDYVATAYQKKIVAGYPDKTFKPENTVNKAEFTKMLLLALNIPVPEKVAKSSYKNVPHDAWYAPYFEVAHNKNLFTEKNDFINAEEGMTREEVAGMIYRAVMLKVSGAESYDSTSVVAGTKLNKYFGVY